MTCVWVIFLCVDVFVSLMSLCLHRMSNVSFKQRFILYTQIGFDKCLSSVQLAPPHEAEVLQTPETFNITWKSGYETHPYLAQILDYELLLQTSQSKESKVSLFQIVILEQQVQEQSFIWFFSTFLQTFQANSHVKSVLVQRSQLEPNAAYCIKVRAKPFHDEYKGAWSKWSPSTCWKNEAREGKETRFLQYKGFIVLPMMHVIHRLLSAVLHCV